MYLHILSLVEKDKLVLSGLKQKVLSAKIHGGINVKFNQTSGKLEIILPAEVLDEVDTIVELALDAPVSAIIKQKPVKSMFEAPEFGSVISGNAALTISSASRWDEKNSHVQLFTGKLTGEAFCFPYRGRSESMGRDRSG